LVTKRRGEYSARLNAVRRTNGSVCSSWPTVTANEDSYRIGGDSQQSKCLSAMARRGEMNWPTPAARDHKDSGENVNMGKVAAKCKLAGAVAMSGPPALENPSTHGSRPESWSTPTVTDASAMSPEMRPSRIATGRTTEYLARQSQWNGTQGKLNPRWVETLMGLPVGWTMPSCASPVTIGQTSCASLVTE
jgi:hypothetical protein